jgi:hypothetical protein
MSFIWQLRKLILLGVLAVMYDGSPEHLAGSLLTTFIALILHMQLAPYLNSGLNVSQRLALISQFLTIFAGLMLIVTEYLELVLDQQQSERGKELLAYLIMLVNLLANVLYPVYRLTLAIADASFEDALESAQMLLTHVIPAPLAQAALSAMSNCTSEAVDHAQDLAVRARDARDAASVMRRILNKARDGLAPDRNSVHPEPADLGAIDDIENHDLDEVSNVIGPFADAACAGQTAGVDDESEGPPSIASSDHELDEVSNVIRIGQFADAARAVQTAGFDDESEGPPSIPSSVHQLDEVSNVIRIGQFADAACAVQTAGGFDESEGTPSIPSSRASVSNPLSL